MRISYLTVLTFVAALSACDRLPFVDNDRGAMPRMKFVDTVVALRRAALQSPSPAEFTRLKTEHLAQTGVSEKDLQRFIEVHGGDAVYMSAVWDSVSQRTERPPARMPVKKP